MDKEKVLGVNNLQISFRTQAGILKAVRNISFDLYRGETLAIVGESGSGKSVTSKAIIGILAGNSIVEGGEINFDGQDLLKIDEEHFHKIRGNKISMIFQDPLSSLNPIMRVGQQLNEAMILNGKARQKAARSEFNSRLKDLKKAIDKTNSDLEENNKFIKTFNGFCVKSCQLEKVYNTAQAAAIGLKAEIDELLFLIEKNQKIDYRRTNKKIRTSLKSSINTYVLSESEANGFINSLEGLNSENIATILSDINNALEKAINKKVPNFFRLGYYKIMNPDFNEAEIDVDKLDEITLEYLDNEFLNDFIDVGTQGIQYSHKNSIENKKNCLVELDKFKELFTKENLDKKEIKNAFKPCSKAIRDAIDGLTINNEGIEYSFDISVSHEIERYFTGVKNNPKNLAKFKKQEVKYNKLVASGKTLTWKLIKPYIIDLDLTKENIIKIIDAVKNRFENDINLDSKFDAHKEMVNLIDFFKDRASRFIYKVTTGIAKARTLELLKEVGIPEPQIRYKQYPFEFSGGMRQRIVIAIALSANPDILICDEPTTALDVTIQSQILELINKIKKERNLSVIFITHDLGVVANMADRIAVMYAGKIVEYGTSEDIFYDPRHPYTWALLSSMPDLDTKDTLEAIPGTPPNMIYPPKGDAFADRNKYALEIDYEMEPPLFEVSDTHFAATWLLHPNAPKIDPPKIVTNRIKRMLKEAENNE